MNMQVKTSLETGFRERRRGACGSVRRETEFFFLLLTFR